MQNNELLLINDIIYKVYTIENFEEMKETFLKLPEEKKNKIIKAAKKEFERVPFEQTSIKNIVEDADIARGSFYQYFDSKEDLLRIYLKYTF